MISELCLRYGITLPTGYERLERYREEVSPGLGHRSRRPRSCPHRIPFFHRIVHP